MIIEMIGEPAGFSAAIYGMRNPMDSWSMSDSELDIENNDTFIIGDKDKDLSIRLQKAGPEHCKHLRMIYVWANIKAPRLW